MPHAVLVDSNVLLDVLEENSVWCDWSAGQLATLADRSLLWINPVIYAEVSIAFARIEEVEVALPEDMFLRRQIPWEAAFLAGKAFLSYRRRGGERRSPLTDFFIGAHAALENVPLLTRDASRYRSYFPKLELICP